MSQPPTTARQFLTTIATSLVRGILQVGEPVGTLFLNRCTNIANILSILWATFWLATRPSTWSPPVRAMFSRQMLFTAFDSIPTAFRFSATVGVLIIVQAAIWMDMIGISIDSVAPALWRFVVREASPLLACMVVIGRSGVAIGTELATMRAGGEIEVLDSHGIDPMTYLVVPRVLAMILSIFCIALIMAATIVVTGYYLGWLMDAIHITWAEFFTDIARNINIDDMVFFGSKTLIAGGFAGAICCTDGLNIRGAITEVPLVSSRVVIHALTAVFVVSAVLSILFYGKLLVFKIG